MPQMRVRTVAYRPLKHNANESRRRTPCDQTLACFYSASVFNALRSSRRSAREQACREDRSDRLPSARKRDEYCERLFALRNRRQARGFQGGSNVRKDRNQTAVEERVRAVAPQRPAGLRRRRPCRRLRDSRVPPRSAQDAVTLRWWSPQSVAGAACSLQGADRRLRSRQSGRQGGLRADLGRGLSGPARRGLRLEAGAGHRHAPAVLRRRRPITARAWSSRSTTSSRRSAPTSIIPAPTTSTRPPTATIAAPASATPPPTCCGCART